MYIVKKTPENNPRWFKVSLRAGWDSHVITIGSSQTYSDNEILKLAKSPIEYSKTIGFTGKINIINYFGKNSRKSVKINMVNGHVHGLYPKAAITTRINGMTTIVYCNNGHVDDIGPSFIKNYSIGFNDDKGEITDENILRIHHIAPNTYYKPDWIKVKNIKKFPPKLSECSPVICGKTYKNIMPEDIPMIRFESKLK